MISVIYIIFTFVNMNDCSHSINVTVNISTTVVTTTLVLCWPFLIESHVIFLGNLCGIYAVCWDLYAACIIHSCRLFLQLPIMYCIPQICWDSHCMPQSLRMVSYMIVSEQLQITVHDSKNSAYTTTWDWVNKVNSVFTQSHIVT